MASSWKERLKDALPENTAEEIDAFEAQLERRTQGKVDEKLFAELRLRRGVYGQRYDNGQRHDGVRTRTLSFPERPTKGPDTLWDAPGMQRIKIPFGKLSAVQLEVLAELAEEYSDGILHVTTRQDIQLHFVHIEDTPDLMRRLAAVGITTREACGNSVRNVTACPTAGVCATETFDVAPYAHALTYFLLGHPDVQDFGRKFKIAFSGCADEACALTNFHDMGMIARVRTIDGAATPGFEVYVGGGLGAVPHEARLFEEFVPASELLPLAQAIGRVFARLGEKRSRAKARLKFLVQKLGTEEFRRLVREERSELRPDPRWTSLIADLTTTEEHPKDAPSPLPSGPFAPGFEAWCATNVRPQRQPGYFIATITCPLGDLTSSQARGVAALARRFTGDTLRTTVEQNLLFRWVSGADIVPLYEGLVALGLGEPGAETIADVTACPGTDTCKLGIAASRGLAGELRARLPLLAQAADERVRGLRVKTSGCFNSCGQHHVADLGFYGVSRTVGARRVPHFQVVLGGKWKENGGAFGLAIGAVPSKNAPAAIDVLTRSYRDQGAEGETFQDFIKRLGKGEVKKLLAPLMKVPAYEVDPSFYSDWGDPREYTIGDMGVGECAGEVVPVAQFGLAESEREVFEAQLKLDHGDARAAAELAYRAMLTAAQALTRQLGRQVGDDPDDVVSQFRTHLCDTKLFHDRFMGTKFAEYLLTAHGQRTFDTEDRELAHKEIEQAQLFIDASHACLERLTAGPGPGAA